MIEQGTGPIADVSALHGDFWPEEESIEEFSGNPTSGAATSVPIPPH